MAGHVHNAEAAAAREIAEGEAEFNGDAPALFFFQPVAVDAGERANERRLAVIDMPGRAHDDSHAVSSAGLSGSEKGCFPPRSEVWGFLAPKPRQGHDAPAPPTAVLPDGKTAHEGVREEAFP